MFPLVVVDEEDMETGSSSYENIHSKGLLHRFIIVHVYDKDGQYFLQKRASSKPHGCMYAESVCAHVRYGEDYIDTAGRRIREELGLGIEQPIKLKEIIKDKVYTKDEKWINNAFVKIFECTTNEKPKINKEEVKEGEFLEMSKVIEKFNKEPHNFVPGFRQTFPIYLRAKSTGSHHLKY